MKNLSIVGAGLAGVTLLIIVLGSYGWLIRPEATKIFSQFPTSGVFIAVVTGITMVSITLIVALTWTNVQNRQFIEATIKNELKDELQQFLMVELTTKISAVTKGYQDLINKEVEARKETVESQMFPKHKERIEYLLKLHNAHRKVTEKFNRNGKILRREIGAATLDLTKEIKELLAPQSEELTQAIELFLKTTQEKAKDK